MRRFWRDSVCVHFLCLTLCQGLDIKLHVSQWFTNQTKVIKCNNIIVTLPHFSSSHLKLCYVGKRMYEMKMQDFQFPFLCERAHMRPCGWQQHTRAQWFFILLLSLWLREHRECGGSKKEVHTLRENRPRVSRSLVRASCYGSVSSSTMSRGCADHTSDTVICVTGHQGGRLRSRDWKSSEWRGEDKRTLKGLRATLA